MAVKWLEYVALLILALFLSIMYYEPFPVLCLLLLIFLPIVGFIIQFPLLWFVKVEITGFDAIGEMGAGNTIIIKIKNQSWIPAFRLRIYLKTENELSGQKQKKYIDVKVPVQGTIRIPLYIYWEYCGSLCVEIQKVRFFGIIPIYCWKLPKKKIGNKVKIIVLPPIQEVSMRLSQDTKNHNLDWETLKIKKENAQIYQVRPFQPGDRLQRIHWKLTARTDEWMIREIITPKGAGVLLVMDWKGLSFDGLNQIIEAAISLALGMAMVSCKSLLISSLTPNEWFTMNGEEDLYFIFGEIMGQNFKKNKKEKKVSDDVPFISVLEQKCVGTSFAHLYYITDRSDEYMIRLLATSHIAGKKTLISAGKEFTGKYADKKKQSFAVAMEQSKIEWICMGEHNEKTLEQWDWIV